MVYDWLSVGVIMCGRDTVEPGGSGGGWGVRGFCFRFGRVRVATVIWVWFWVVGLPAAALEILFGWNGE